MVDLKIIQGVEKIIASLLLFIVSVTGWTIPEENPRLVVDEKRVFLNMGRDAAYQGDGVILVQELSADLTPELVHEGVHFFQDKQGRMHKQNTSKEECMLEVEAERIENLFREKKQLEQSGFYKTLCAPAAVDK